MASLKLDTSDYDGKLDDSKEKASGFGNSLKTGLGTAAKVGAASVAAMGAAVTAAGASIYNSASAAAAYGDEIDKTSQKIGFSTDAYQKWDYVMQLAGTSMSASTTGMKTLTNQIDNAKNGSEDAQKMFSKLGISLDDLNSMSREEAFAAVVEGMQEMADSTDRAALANDLFGKSGQEMTPLFNMTTQATAEAMQATEEYGMIMSSEAVEASANLRIASQN